MANLFARTTLGPLTTTYTPPASCNVAVEQCSTCINAWAGQTCFASTTGSTINYGVQDNPGCWPPRLDDSISTPIPPFQGWGFYTPGLICPVGYASACSATAGGSSGWSVQYSMTAGETAVGCCPSGYTCTAGYAQTCISFADSTSVPLVSCESGTTGAFSYFTLPLTADTVTISTMSFYAPMFQINWKATDRPASTSATPTSSPSTSSQTSSPSSTPTSTPSVGLSTGAKAGIGIGAALGTLAVLALLAFLWRRHRHQYSKTAQSPTAAGRFEMGGKEAYGNEIQKPAELPNNGVYNRGPVSELQ